MSRNLDALLGQDQDKAIPATCDEPTLAALLGISRTRTSTLARDGVISRIARGRYDTRAAVRAYCENLRFHAARAGRPSEASGDELKAEKLRLTRAQAEKAEAAAALARGDLVKAEEVRREWEGVLRDLRAALLAVPSRVGAVLPHLAPHDLAEIDREIRATLEGLADGSV